MSSEARRTDLALGGSKMDEPAVIRVMVAAKSLRHPEITPVQQAYELTQSEWDLLTKMADPDFGHVPARRLPEIVAIFEHHYQRIRGNILTTFRLLDAAMRKEDGRVE